MSQEIFTELAVFMQSFLAGVTVILAYDMLRILRKVIRHGTILLAIEDLLYWIGCALFLFQVLFRINDGQIRWYSLAGIAMGMMLYNFTLSAILVKYTSAVIQRILKLSGNFILFVTRPFRWILKKIMGFLKYLSRKIKLLAKYIKKRLKNIYKEVKILLCKH